MAVIARRLPRKVQAEIRKSLGLSGPPKYGNEKVRLDSYLFDSLKEKNRYLVLLMRQKLGEICGLTVHPKFKLLDKKNGQRAVSYVADFSYYTHYEVAGMGGGELVVEDTKGIDPKTGWNTRTPVYKLKKRLMKELLNIEVREI